MPLLSRPFRYALIASLLAHFFVFHSLTLSLGITTRESTGLKARLRNPPLTNAVLRDAPPASSIPHSGEASSAGTLLAGTETVPAFPLRQTGEVSAPDVEARTFPGLTPAPLAVFPDPDALARKRGRGEEVAALENDSAVDRDSLRQYVLALGVQARHFKNYPALARSRGESGTSTIALEIGFGPPSAVLVHSSGHPLLDEEALTMLRQAAAHTRLPAALQGRRVRISVPVRFDSESE